jgi:hypothetical protein
MIFIRNQWSNCLSSLTLLHPSIDLIGRLLLKYAQLPIPLRSEQSIVIHFDDSGPGISDPEVLSRPYQRHAEVTGLGLCVSRALMRSFAQICPCGRDEPHNMCTRSRTIW